MTARHPLSAAWGDMPNDEFNELVADIRDNGLREPIVMLDGMVLDGWHRYRACQALGRECSETDLPAEQNPVAWVISRNARRRSLNAGQKALAIVQCSEWAPEGRPGNSAPGAEFSTTAQMARGGGVSPRTIEQAKVVKRKATPEVKGAVRSGQVSVKRAADIAQLPEREQPRALHGPKPLKQPAADEPGRARIANDAHVDVNLVAELEEAHRELQSLHALLEVAGADDLKAEAIKWRKAYESAMRTANEKMENAARLERMLRQMSDRLVRIGKLFGERDPARVPALVEALHRQAKAAA